jgi:hypothetical protein
MKTFIVSRTLRLHSHCHFIYAWKQPWRPGNPEVLHLVTKERRQVDDIYELIYMSIEEIFRYSLESSPLSGTYSITRKYNLKYPVLNDQAKDPTRFQNSSHAVPAKISGFAGRYVP